ncbi:eukaryotic translation initiation factor 2 [Wolffia australiana]
MAGADNLTVLQFFPSPASASANIHPVVLFNICDSFVRRPDQAERVIGTLLGYVAADGTVEIRNSYAVPHNESSDQVALDIDYHHNMLISHQKVNPKEVLVGWFSTGFGVSGGSALIHDFYSRETSNPVHLTVDTGFVNGEASIKAYVSISLSLGDRQLAAQFHEIPVELLMSEAERIGVGLLKQPKVEKLPGDLEGMEASMIGLLSLVKDIYRYVDGVVEGEIIPDNNIGRSIADSLALVPKMSPAALDKLFNDRLQDNALLAYLSSIARTQLVIAEKLNTAAQVL